MAPPPIGGRGKGVRWGPTHPGLKPGAKPHETLPKGMKPLKDVDHLANSALEQVHAHWPKGYMIAGYVEASGTLHHPFTNVVLLKQHHPENGRAEYAVMVVNDHGVVPETIAVTGIDEHNLGQYAELLAREATDAAFLNAKRNLAAMRTSHGIDAQDPLGTPVDRLLIHNYFNDRRKAIWDKIRTLRSLPEDTAPLHKPAAPPPPLPKILDHVAHRKPAPTNNRDGLEELLDTENQLSPPVPVRGKAAKAPPLTPEQNKTVDDIILYARVNSDPTNETWRDRGVYNRTIFKIRNIGDMLTYTFTADGRNLLLDNRMFRDEDKYLATIKVLHGLDYDTAAGLAKKAHEAYKYRENHHWKKSPEAFPTDLGALDARSAIWTLEAYHRRLEKQFQQEQKSGALESPTRYAAITADSIESPRHTPQPTTTRLTTVNI